MNQKSKFIELKKIFKTLHGPKGCLWDKEQTYLTLIPQLRQEVREFIDSAKKRNHAHMKEELGDILLHVMFNAQLAAKENKFDIEDVIDELIRKLKRRHPHVFGTTKVKSSQQIIANWKKIKIEERKHLALKKS